MPAFFHQYQVLDAPTLTAWKTRDEALEALAPGESIDYRRDDSGAWWWCTVATLPLQTKDAPKPAFVPPPPPPPPPAPIPTFRQGMSTSVKIIASVSVVAFFGVAMMRTAIEGPAAFPTFPKPQPGEGTRVIATLDPFFIPTDDSKAKKSSSTTRTQFAYTTTHTNAKGATTYTVHSPRTTVSTRN